MFRVGLVKNGETDTAPPFCPLSMSRHQTFSLLRCECHYFSGFSDKDKEHSARIFYQLGYLKNLLAVDIDR